MFNARQSIKLLKSSSNIHSIALDIRAAVFLEFSLDFQFFFSKLEGGEIQFRKLGSVGSRLLNLFSVFYAILQSL
jgi:hypothetical protein